MRLIDHLSTAAQRISMVMVLALTAVMIFEVVARYAFNAPTIWAADLSYMLNGAMFMLASAFALKERGHVRIDFMVSGLSRAWQDRLFGALLLGLFVPAVTMIGWVAAGRAWKSFVTGETEPVSIWQPVIWPFHLAIAVGLWALTLQALAEGVRSFSRR